MSEATRIWGACSECSRKFELKKDGTVRHHGGKRRDQMTGWREYRCAGADLYPSTLTGAAGYWNQATGAYAEPRSWRAVPRPKDAS